MPECHRCGSASAKETIEPEGKAEKPTDSDAVVGKGAMIRGLEVRWSGPGLAHRRWRSRSKHRCECYCRGKSTENKSVPLFVGSARY